MALQLRRLTPAHLTQLVPLDLKLFPPAFHCNVEGIKMQLIWAELWGRNYSVGAFDDGKLVGYLMIVRQSSALRPGEDVLVLADMAVERGYRRAVVPPMLGRALRVALLNGLIVEGRLRETTSLHTLFRKSALLRKIGFRVTAISPHELIGGERMITLRFEHIFARDAILHELHLSIGSCYRMYHRARALPRHILWRFCLRLPAQHMPLWLGRLSYSNPQAVVDNIATSG